MATNHRKTAILAGAASNFIMGFNFIIEKLIDQIDGISPSPLIILAYECTICMIVMTLFIPIAKPDFGKIKRLGIKKLYPIIGMAVFDPVLFYIGTTYATQYGASPIYITVMIATMPIFAMITGIFVLKEIPTVLQAVFSVISVAGVIAYSIVAARYSSDQAGVISVPVVLFLLLTVAAGVGYGMFSRHASTNLSSFERTYWCFFCAMIIVDVLAVTTNLGDISADVQPLTSPRFIVLAGIFGILPLAFNYTAYNYAMNYLQASQAMIFSGLSNVATFIFTNIIFEGERVALIPKIICIVFILLGVIGAELFGRKE